MAKWNSVDFSNPGRLQHQDNVVQSIKDCRKAYAGLTDREFAAWYEQHQKVPERRVLAILAALNADGGGAA